jgi:hypothetical protein
MVVFHVVFLQLSCHILPATAGKQGEKGITRQGEDDNRSRGGGADGQGAEGVPSDILNIGRNTRKNLVFAFYRRKKYLKKMRS